MASSRFSREFRLGFVVLGLGLALFAVLRWWLLPRFMTSPVSPSATTITDAERQALTAFEQQRRADSVARAQQWEQARAAKARRNAQSQARYQAQKAAWAHEKAERQALQRQRQAYYDSLRSLRPEKFKAGTRLDANTADTTQLTRIPGIGIHYARAIVAYRERLGGFVAPSQVPEAAQLPHGIEHWFRLDPNARPHRLPINRASFKELLRHPYLNYEQVKAIVNRRQKMGPLRDWSDLNNDPHFTERDFERLQPYARFD